MHLLDMEVVLQVGSCRTRAKKSWALGEIQRYISVMNDGTTVCRTCVWYKDESIQAKVRPVSALRAGWSARWRYPPGQAHWGNWALGISNTYVLAWTTLWCICSVYNFNYMNMQQSCRSGPCLIMFYDTALRVCCGLIATKTYYSCMLLLIMFCLETLRGSLDSFPLGVNSKYYANLKLTTYFLWSNLIILLYI